MNAFFKPDHPKKDGEKYALVLGGGGGKGSYHMGVWLAFSQMKIGFDAVSGTSIGALFGLFYAQEAMEPMTDFVMNMAPDHIVNDMPELPVTVRDTVRSFKKIVDFVWQYKDVRMDVTPLRENFRQMLDYDRLMASPIKFGCMTYNDTRKEGRAFTKDDFTPDNIEDVLIASASCYPAFPKVEMMGETYMDGSYADNVPIQLVEQLEPDAAWTVVVDIHEPDQESSKDLDPSKMMLIQPLINPGNSLDFRQEHARELFRQGYLETMKYMDRFPGYIYTFTPGARALMQITERYLDAQFEQNQIVLPSSDTLAKDALAGMLEYVPYDLENSFMKDYNYGLLVEALGLLGHVDPLSLYDYHHFLEEMVKGLSSLKATNTTDTDYKLVEIFSNLKRDELTIQLHRSLERNNGSYPQTIVRLRDLIPIPYTLALVWYYMEKLVQFHPEIGDRKESGENG